MDEKRGSIAVIGTFDGVHQGHIYLLEALKAIADKENLFPMVVTFSSHPLETIRPEKVPPLLTPLSEKERILGVEGIKKIVLMDFNDTLRNMSASEFMEMLRDNYGVETLLLGYDTRFGHDRPDGIEAYQGIGKKIGINVLQAQEFIRAGNPVSSSRIRKSLATGDIKTANNLLGRNYSISGTVVAGKQLGRKIGFPTANISLSEPKQLTPKPGVYAVTVQLPDLKKYNGILNIGFRPTVDKSEMPRLTLEVHILGFSGDLYGQDIKIEFIDRIRDEQKFNGTDELRSQLALDAETAQSILAQSTGQSFR